MINTVKSLLKRTEELENNLKSFEEVSTASNNSFFTIENNFVNLAILSKENMILGEINVLKNTNISLQCNFNINLSSKQSITFKLKAGEITLAKTTQEYAVGNHNINFFENYTPLTSNLVKIYLEVSSNDNKLIYLQHASLNVWGAVQNETKTHSYQAIKTNNQVLLSYINNNCLYYKFADLVASSYEPNDFIYHSRTLAHSFVYSETNEKLYLFRIDANNNLLFSEFLKSNEILIETNVTFVSACASNDAIAVSYIKNKFCYLFKIQDNIFSIHKRFTKLKRLLSKCGLFFNKFNNRFYLILTDVNKSNYLIESTSANNHSNENIKAKYNIKITSYGESNEL